MDENQKGNIRAISRGLDVLRAINQHRSLGMTAISTLCDIPYPTACRIVDTLVAEELIERESTRKRYRPTAHVKALSVGYQDDDKLAHASRPLSSVYPALGSKIHADLARALGADCTEEGCIRVDDHQRTSVEGLYAAGDVVLGLDQISHAMGEAGVAATTIRNDLAQRYSLLR